MLSRGLSAALVALVALLIARNAHADSTGAPRNGADRFYIGIGVSKSPSVAVDPNLLRDTRTFLTRRVAQLKGVILAPERETAREAQTFLRQHSLSGFYLDATISSVERQANGALRVSVSILVATYPDRSMRAIMRGAATAVHGTDRGAGRAAIEAALTAALRQLDRALAPHPR